MQSIQASFAESLTGTSDDGRTDASLMNLNAFWHVWKVTYRVWSTKSYISSELCSYIRLRNFFHEYVSQHSIYTRIILKSRVIAIMMPTNWCTCSNAISFMPTEVISCKSAKIRYIAFPDPHTFSLSLVQYQFPFCTTHGSIQTPISETS